MAGTKAVDCVHENINRKLYYFLFYCVINVKIKRLHPPLNPGPSGSKYRHEEVSVFL